MKKYITLILFLALFSISFARPVDENTAKAVGKSFIASMSKYSPKLLSNTDLELVYTASNINTRVPSLKQADVKTGSGQDAIAADKGGAVNYYYVFNFRQSDGFIIVSADDDVQPILGYSYEKKFKIDNMPVHVAKWLEGYKIQIRHVVENGIKAGEEVKAKWDALFNKHYESLLKVQAAVSPLMSTQWDQSPYYNDLCPYDNDYNDKAVTGCVATAMAQIMKFWNYPEIGTGFHSYSHNKYGELSANFGSTTYHWNQMPNQIAAKNDAIATLIYQVGVSVDMNYGVGSQGGSAAYVVTAKSPVTNCAEYALKTYFGYKETLKGMSREDYTDQQWISALKTELDKSRPVLYAGFGSGGGHCFVCDGYDNNEYFHFNWGWSGYYDGFFLVDALEPGGVGTGGGNGGYNSGQQAVIGIEPIQKGPQTYLLQLNGYVVPSATTIYYGSPFSVTTNIVNNGAGNFSGDYCAAIFDDKLNFVDFVQVLTGATLQSGYTYTNGLTFSTESNFSILPGTYYIGIFYRPTNGNWMIVGDNGSWTNGAMITIVNPNDISLYSKITTNQGTTIIQKKPVTVNFDIANTSFDDFIGSLNVAIYKTDGTYVTSIGQIDNLELPSNKHFTNGLTFNSQGLDIPPGTYLMAVVHKWDDSQSWELTGSSNDYQNPIKFIVQEPSLAKDKYEDNNDINTAYRLNVNFTGNNATINTAGSNCHTGSDYDFYKIQLPAGYNYTIKPVMNDEGSQSSSYTLNALFSYSTDGKNWSDAYVGDMPDQIKVNGGGTVYLFVAPYFAGETGTYQLDVNITRTITGVEETVVQADGLSVWPNPASDFVNIDLTRNTCTVKNVEITNSLGQNVYSARPGQGNNSIKLPVAGLSEGMYILQLDTDKGILSKKIIIRR